MEGEKVIHSNGDNYQDPRGSVQPVSSLTFNIFIFFVYMYSHCLFANCFRTQKQKKEGELDVPPI